MSSVPERSEIETEYKWDLESVYATDDEWEQAYEEVEERLGEIADYEGRVTEDGQTLLEVLRLGDELFRKVEVVANYARMRKDENTADQQYQALSEEYDSEEAATDADAPGESARPAAADEE